MSQFSPSIQDFLDSVGADPNRNVAIVPKSDSAGNPGDILLFRYKLGIGKGSIKFRIFMLIEPITKIAGTGNLLMTGFKVPKDGVYTPDSLENLYKNRELPKDNYRTYIMSRVWGPLRRVNKTSKSSKE